MKRRFRSLYQSSGTALYGVEPERCVGRSVRRLPPSPSSALAGQPADERVRPVWRRSVASELAPNRNTTLHTRKRPTQQQRRRRRGLRQQGRKLPQEPCDARHRVTGGVRESRGYLFECGQGLGKGPVGLEGVAKGGQTGFGPTT